MNSTNIKSKILESYKMKLFNELIKQVWNENIEDINNLPEKILGKDIYRQVDKATIVNLTRIIMGLNPNYDDSSELKEMICEAIHIDEVQEPIISVIEQACHSCTKNNEKNETCLIKNKHKDCNKNNICSACGDCINKCNIGAVSDKIQFIPIIKLLKDLNTPVYAIVAPSFVGQFGIDVTPGKLRSGLKKIGFKDMIEVAVAADILTIKEAYEYCKHMKEESGCFITSCCCPVWVNLIQKEYPQILKNISPSVSPMVACGRAIKILDSKSKVVFIGPCIAKKKEATLDDVKDAVDFVLTFTELDEIFKALDVDLNNMHDDKRQEASFSGRIYARSKGVSEAIELSVKNINPDIPFKSLAFQGIKECREGLDEIMNKKIDATFIEGMGCIGGCIGGPKKIIDLDKANQYINNYAKETEMLTPYENLNVIQFLTMLGIKRFESLDEKEEEEILKIFSRNLVKQ